MKKILLLSLIGFALSACSALQVQEPTFEESPCSCLKLPFPLEESVQNG